MRNAGDAFSACCLPRPGREELLTPGTGPSAFPGSAASNEMLPAPLGLLSLGSAAAADLAGLLSRQGRVLAASPGMAAEHMLPAPCLCSCLLSGWVSPALPHQTVLQKQKRQWHGLMTPESLVPTAVSKPSCQSHYG